MNRQSRHFYQSGFSLLEVLVTMIIIAVGLMGFAAMMVQSMKNNRISMQRSTATFYAYDIIDCMRVNRSAVTSGSYSVNFGDIKTGTTVVANDINIWQLALSTKLPSGQGKITFVGNTAKIEIKWTETTSDSATHTWVTESAL
jgi:type IV pilus assembly protein PilV